MMGKDDVQSVSMDGDNDTLEGPPAVGNHFGEHFMIDAYRGSISKLLDRDRVQRSLSELPARLGMQKLAEPMVYWAEPNDVKDPGGWSGVVVIVESHISIHTFPVRGFASIDVYTCRSGLPTAEIEAYFREMFDFDELETNFVIRGTRYPMADHAHPQERRQDERRTGDRRIALCGTELANGMAERRANPERRTISGRRSSSDRRGADCNRRATISAR